MPRGVSQFCRLPQELVDIVIAQLRGNKNALKTCSLVCWAWSISSATQLYEIFIWPRCARVLCAPVGIDAQNDSYTILSEVLAASPRFRDSIRVLRLSTHYRWCAQAHENDSSLASTVSRLLAFLPHLRSLTLEMNDINPTTSIMDSELERQQGLAIVDEVYLCCPPHAIPTLLSVFRRISRLRIRLSYRRDDEDEVAPPSPHLIAAVEVCSIVTYEDAPTVLPILQHILVPSAVRALDLDCTPTVDQPEVLTFVRSCRSLQSLQCGHLRADKVPFDDGLERPSLRSVTLPGTFTMLTVEPRRRRAEGEPGQDADVAAAPPTPPHVGDVRGGEIISSGLREVLRDLRVLVTQGTEEITLRLHIKQRRPRRLDVDYDDGNYYDDPEDVTRALRKAFSQLDWRGFEAVARQSASLKELRFAVVENGLTTEQRAGDILREALGTYLPDDLAAKAHVINAFG